MSGPFPVQREQATQQNASSNTSRGESAPAGATASSSLRGGDLPSQEKMLSPGAQPGFAAQSAQLAPVQRKEAGGGQGGAKRLPWDGRVIELWPLGSATSLIINRGSKATVRLGDQASIKDSYLTGDVVDVWDYRARVLVKGATPSDFGAQRDIRLGPPTGSKPPAPDTDAQAPTPSGGKGAAPAKEASSKEGAGGEAKKPAVRTGRVVQVLPRGKASELIINRGSKASVQIGERWSLSDSHIGGKVVEVWDYRAKVRVDASEAEIGDLRDAHTGAPTKSKPAAEGEEVAAPPAATPAKRVPATIKRVWVKGDLDQTVFRYTVTVRGKPLKAADANTIVAHVGQGTQNRDEHEAIFFEAIRKHLKELVGAKVGDAQIEELAKQLAKSVAGASMWLTRSGQRRSQGGKERAGATTAAKTRPKIKSASDLTGGNHSGDRYGEQNVTSEDRPAR